MSGFRCEAGTVFGCFGVMGLLRLRALGFRAEGSSSDLGRGTSDPVSLQVPHAEVDSAAAERRS